MLLQAENSAIRRNVDRWFDELKIRPNIVGEFDDSALLNVFGQAGRGVFPGPSVIEPQICRQYRVEASGRAAGVRERYFAISVERKSKHPAVLAITSSAKTFITGERIGVG